MPVFAFPRVGRAGLGNCLFPWARAEVFGRHSGACILAPHWSSLRLGPYLRRESDKRRYSGFFQATHHLHGLHRLWALGCGYRFKETELTTIREDASRSARPYIVEFSGADELFEPLLGEREFIRDALWKMTREPLRSRGEQYGPRFIAMHIRRADFLLKEMTICTPLSWFISMARAIREDKRLRRIPIVVFTDGTLGDVRDLLAMDGVCLHKRKSAITDLWTLSHASLFFATGFSTFSMWASFLGAMPTIYAPGEIRQRVLSGSLQPIEIEIAEGQKIPAEALIRTFAS
jgi:hypothetical protein